MWYTNADVITLEEASELRQHLNSSKPPELIPITKLKPKSYTTKLSKMEYKLKGSCKF